MNWHTWVMEQHAMAQWVWPLQHLCPLNLLLLWKKQKRKSAPQRESKARDLEPVMGKSQIQTTILRLERRAVKDTVPNLLLEIHMNSTGGQGANNLCHYPPCASKVFLHHQIMLRLACFLFRLPYCCVCWSAFLPTEIELLINFWSKLEFQNQNHTFWPEANTHASVLRRMFLCAGATGWVGMGGGSVVTNKCVGARHRVPACQSAVYLPT